MEIYQFFEWCNTEKQERPHLRRGQIMFNKLVGTRNDLAEAVRGSNIDPFYLDKCSDNPNRWDSFIEFLMENW